MNINKGSRTKYLHIRHVIIDIHARKVVAQYAADYKQGCLIDNEYWVCVEDRILRKPFPAFEEAPAVKVVGGFESFYGKHPEFW